MLQPYNITFPLYAETEQEAKQLEIDLKEYVKARYNQKIYIRASKISQILKQYGNNIIVNSFLKQ